MNTTTLFAASTLIWGTTWIAITFQLGSVPPEFSVAWRFMLAAALLFGWCLWRGESTRFNRAQHGWLLAHGALGFFLSYIAVYHAEKYIVSGLVAVGYSATPLINMMGVRWLFGTPIERRVVIGGVMGLVGISLIFAPEFRHLDATGRTALGIALTVFSVFMSAAASMVATGHPKRGITLFAGMAWAMLYGALLAFVMALALHGTPTISLTTPYLLSLTYLAVFGSIVAFGSYFTVLNRIGAARAGYIGVMVPVVALLISAVFEKFDWHLLTFAGVAVSVIGNVIILRKRAT